MLFPNKNRRKKLLLFWHTAEDGQVQTLKCQFLLQIYSVKQAENDIAAVFSMGLFSDVNITPHAYRTGTPDNPKVSHGDS